MGVCECRFTRAMTEICLFKTPDRVKPRNERDKMPILGLNKKDEDMCFWDLIHVGLAYAELR